MEERRRHPIFRIRILISALLPLVRQYSYPVVRWIVFTEGATLVHFDTKLVDDMLNSPAISIGIGIGNGIDATVSTTRLAWVQHLFAACRHRDRRLCPAQRIRLGNGYVGLLLRRPCTIHLPA